VPVFVVLGKRRQSAIDGRTTRHEGLWRGRAVRAFVRSAMLQYTLARQDRAGGPLSLVATAPPPGHFCLVAISLSQVFVGAWSYVMPNTVSVRANLAPGSPHGAQREGRLACGAHL
jgi:hypothetical protein